VIEAGNSDDIFVFLRVRFRIRRVRVPFSRFGLARNTAAKRTVTAKRRGDDELVAVGVAKPAKGPATTTRRVTEKCEVL
jgi:hypothetical protein